MQSQLSRKRRLLVPEVVQTSSMDCGPATLKCLLEGYGIGVHYGRLREACQTDLDGSSIDTVEVVVNRLGLEAEQVMLPLDHLLLPQADALPAILVVRKPGGAPHFVLVWRRHGPLVQVMDPGQGRRWMTGQQLLAETFVHRQRVSAADWRAWAGSPDMCGPLAYRLRRLGLGREAGSLIAAAAGDPGWRGLAQLDAAVRAVAALVRAGGLRRGSAAGSLLQSLLAPAHAAASPAALIPDRFWSVRPVSEPADGDEQVVLSGAVLVRVAGRVQERSPQPASVVAPAAAPPADAAGDAAAPLGAELAAALSEPDRSPLVAAWRLVRGVGWISLLALLAGLGLAAVGLVLEALVLRGILDLGHDLALVEQRLEAIGCFLILGSGLLWLEYRVGAGLLRIGRRLELGLRAEFLQKIPRLHDRYFQSRPLSDMAERGHALHEVRLIPQSAGRLLRAAATLWLTAGAIAWVEPAGALLALLAAAMAILLPLAFLPLLQGLDLRVRTHSGALLQFVFDALQGLTAVRAHGAQSAVQLEHEHLLVEWARTSHRLLRWRVCVAGLQSLTGMALAGWLLLLHTQRAVDATGMLLIAYWALNLPALGEEIALLVQQYPGYRNVTLRLLEPLGAPEQEALAAAAETGIVPDAQSAAERDSPAVAIRLQNVGVRAGGHALLEEVNLDLAPGSHVAIVGVSGAGKSSLLGLLLGWYRPATGQVQVDGQLLDGPRLDALRSQTVWVDPAVQLWNRSLLENLRYGNPATGLEDVGEVVSQADLYDVLQRLPDGLQTALGESGGLLSGGEGQRVKFGRGLAHAPPRLVLLDEPFRGLERERRRLLLERVRRRWSRATLLCVTHDVRETRDFPRVIVIDNGRVLEDGAPDSLAADPNSRYRFLLDAEDAVHRRLWGSSLWRRLQLQAGRLEEERGLT